MFRRILMLVTVVAVMAALVAVSAATALAQPPDRDTFTVRCEGFRIGPGEGEPFTQTLPEAARKGSAKSIEQTNLRSPEDECRQIG